MINLNSELRVSDPERLDGGYFDKPRRIVVNILPVG